MIVCLEHIYNIKNNDLTNYELFSLLLGEIQLLWSNS